MTEPSLPDKITALHRRLAEARIPHAFGGALALAYYAEPRATIDIDLNIFLPPSDFEDVVAALGPLGIEDAASSASVARDGQVRIWWGRTPLDLFFAYDEFHGAMRRGTRSVPFGDEEIRILSPEHLAVCKAVFDRPKDWLDMEQVLVSVDPLDTDEAHRWLVQLAGRGDPRTLRFGDLVDALRSR